MHLFQEVEWKDQLLIENNDIIGLQITIWVHSECTLLNMKQCYLGGLEDIQDFLGESGLCLAMIFNEKLKFQGMMFNDRSMTENIPSSIF